MPRRASMPLVANAAGRARGDELYRIFQTPSRSPAAMEAMDPLDRKAAALHLAKVAYHVSALAKLFDPSVKASKVKGGASAAADGGADGKPPRPKREPTPYTLYIKEQMPSFKEQVRPGDAPNPYLRQGPSERARLRGAHVHARAALAARLGVCAARRSGRRLQRGRAAPALRAARLAFSYSCLSPTRAVKRRRGANLARRATACARAGAALRCRALRPASAARAHLAVARAAPGGSAEGPLPHAGGAVAAGPEEPEGACAAPRVGVPGSRRARAQAGQKHAAAAAAGLAAAAGGGDDGEAKKKKKHKKHDDEAGGDGDGEKKARPRRSSTCAARALTPYRTQQHKKKHKHRDVVEE